MLKAKSTAEPLAVSKFRQYLRVNTEQPTPNFDEAKKFLFAYAEEVGLKPWVYECVSGQPIVGMTLEGSDPKLPAIMLYSHMDVVPTFPAQWTHPPYEAHKDAEGRIYARGTQDMKSVGVQYMEALRELKAKKKEWAFRRTLHVLWGPDEEVGGEHGIGKYVHTQHFRDLGIGFAMDEGLASDNDVYSVYYGQRLVWWIKVTCPGNPGHGSRFIENTAGPKLNSIIQSFSAFRESQKALLESNPKLNLGNVTSVNLTKVEGGVQANVIPSQFTAYFDMRVTPTDDTDALESRIKEWCAKAGADVSYEFLQKNTDKTLTSTDRHENPYWGALEDVFSEEKCEISKEIFIGGVDGRYLRALGLPVIGFSPIINTPILLHDHNEFLHESTFLRGVELYVKIIERLAELP